MIVGRTKNQPQDVDVFIIKVFQDLVQKEKQIGGDQVEELVISTKYIVSNYYKSNILFKRKTEPWSMREPQGPAMKRESCADS